MPRGGEAVKLYSSFNFGARGDVKAMPLPLYPHPRKDPVPIVYEAGWVPGLVWTGVENLTSTGI